MPFEAFLFFSTIVLAIVIDRVIEHDQCKEEED